MQEIYVGDVGTEVKIQIRDKNKVPLDVSGSLARKILLVKPDGVVVSKIAQVSAGDGVGFIKYVLDVGDIDMEGVWEIQGWVQIGIGQWHTKTDSFRVLRGLNGDT